MSAFCYEIVQKSVFLNRVTGMSLISENSKNKLVQTAVMYFWRGTAGLSELLASLQSTRAHTIRLSNYISEEGVAIFVPFSIGCSNNPGEIQREEAPGSAGTAGGY